MQYTLSNNLMYETFDNSGLQLHNLESVADSESILSEVDNSDLSDSDFDEPESLDSDSDESYDEFFEASPGNPNASDQCPESNEFDLQKFLIEWKLKNNVTATATTELLHALKKCGHSDLPSDSRTLVKTPRQNNIQELGSGSYAHYGLKKSLLDQLKSVDCRDVSCALRILVFVDGLSLSKSSRSELWPILIKIADDPIFTEPSVVGIYHGIGKPDNPNTYLESFMHDYFDLHENGFIHNNKQYTVDIKGFIGDTIARNFIMCFPPHDSRCGKCIQVGRMVDRRCVFLEYDSPLRTDETFRFNVPQKYKNLISPLEGIISLVDQVPLDPMHLVNLGVIRRHLKLLIIVVKNLVNGSVQYDLLNADYCSLKEWVPSDFGRKTRSFDWVKYMKAIELRLLGLYTGPVVFAKYLSDEQMLHFNCLNCALRILSDAEECIRNNEYAKDLLVYYVDQMKNLFGAHNLVFCVHNLIHLANDVLKFGPLDAFSAIVFENYLGILKRLVKKGFLILSQIMNRINERAQAKSRSKQKFPLNSKFVLLHEISDPWLPRGYDSAHRVIQFPNFMLTNRKPDNCCSLKDGTIVVIQFICFHDKIPVILGKQYVDCISIKNYPLDSRLLGICQAKTLSNNLEAYPIKEIKKKVFRMFLDETFYLFPILHSHNF